MELFYKLLISLVITIAILIIILFFLISDGSGGLLSASNKFAPGAVDKAKTKTMKVLVFLFMLTLISLAAVDHNINKSKEISILDKNDTILPSTDM